MQTTVPLAVMMVATAILANLFSCADHSSKGMGPAKDVQESAPAAHGVWPEGAVLAVDDAPIFQKDVDRASKWVQFLHPENTQPSLRRMALTHIILDRTTLAVLYPKERDSARGDAESALEELRKGDSINKGRSVTGDWSGLGLALWGETRALEVGSWSGPFELIGRYVLIRKDFHFPGLVPAADKFTVTIQEFPYTPSDFSREDLANASKKVQLSILNRDWEALVPSAWGKSLPTRWYAGPKN